MATMGHESYQVCQKTNRSFYQTIVDPQDPIHFYPRNVACLSEEDYLKQLEQQQKESYDRDSRNLQPEYHSLCEIVTKRVQLDDSEYEYQPPHYHEVYCKSYSLLDNLQRVNPPKQLCVQPSFHCVQRSKTLFFVRRRWDSECWEPYTKEVASGCDCMWPASVLGDIKGHY